MILTVGHTKGGVGKTTLALQIALGRALAGRSVWMIDADAQGTAGDAIKARDDAGREPGIALGRYPDGTLKDQVRRQFMNFDDVVIDAGGRDNAALRAALLISSVIIIPFAPRSFDLWALEDMAKLVTEARMFNEGLKAFAVINQADPTGHDNEDAAAAVAALDGVQYLDAPLTRRKAFSNASADGLAVQELRPRDPKAEAEMNRLLHIINI